MIIKTISLAPVPADGSKDSPKDGVRMHPDGQPMPPFPHRQNRRIGMSAGDQEYPPANACAKAHGDAASTPVGMLCIAAASLAIERLRKTPAVLSVPMGERPCIGGT